MTLSQRVGLTMLALSLAPRVAVPAEPPSGPRLRAQPHPACHKAFAVPGLQTSEVPR
jgi:hypothetical protein